MLAEYYSRLSDAGKAQYDKYQEYYEDKFFDYGKQIDWLSVIESDAKNGTRYDEQMKRLKEEDRK